MIMNFMARIIKILWGLQNIKLNDFDVKFDP